jgi:beta-glucuronidase
MNSRMNALKARQNATGRTASVLYAAWPSAVATLSSMEAATRPRVDLGGTWERHVEGKLFDYVTVPSSLHPFGSYRLKRSVLLPRLSDGQHAWIHFDAITYHGRVFMNGVELGTTIPYVPHEFEITQQAKEGVNQIEVAIVDLLPDPSGAGKDEIALGLNPGWEGYGGIIRDAYIEIRPSAYIDNAQLSYQLNSNYTRVLCRLRVFVSSTIASSEQIDVLLFERNAEVGRASKTIEIPKGLSEVDLPFEVDAPSLWSPSEPNLYDLKVHLKCASGEDSWRCRTGFREFTVHGPEFLLNGKPILLHGVCRHDMWKDQGFTQSRAQLQQDMRMIKALGANFVRLVHYPHYRYVVELADELGLLVTEEPGYWNMDFKTMPSTMIELGYRIMERVVQRDWNSPSVFGWLLANECTLTVDYLRGGKERLRKLDPLGRLVSCANSMSAKESKPILEQAGMDFFTHHLYPPDAGAYAESAEVFGGSRPLVFTEWGWRTGRGETIYPELDTDLLLDLMESKRLAGHSFWSWQDIREYSRIDWPTQDGILLSGIVTEAREIRPDWYLTMARFFQGLRVETLPELVRPDVLPLKRVPTKPGATFQVVELQNVVDSQESMQSWTALVAGVKDHWPKTPMARNQWERTGKKFLFWKEPKLHIAGIPFTSAVVDGYVRPVVLTSDVPEFTIPIGADCSQLHFLGQVMFPAGYPVQGKRGETAATYTVRFAGGKTQEVPVRHGFEVAQSNRVFESTRIDPIAIAAQPAAEFMKDPARERYQILLWSVPVGPGRVESLHCKLNGQQPALTIFAITAERSS